VTINKDKSNKGNRNKYHKVNYGKRRLSPEKQTVTPLVKMFPPSM